MPEPIVTAQTEALFNDFRQAGLRELHVSSGDIEIYLSSDPASTFRIVRHAAGGSTAPLRAPALAPSTPSTIEPVQNPKPPAIAPDAVIVRAPNLGTFYGAPKPGAEAYVSIGTIVSAGAELCLIEVMKLFTAVRAEFDGRIEAILAADGDMVEAGQPLFAIARL